MDEHDREFLERLFKRRPALRAHYEKRFENAGGAGVVFESVGGAPKARLDPETIVREERPVLFVRDDAIVPHADPLGVEAAELVGKLTAQPAIPALFPSIGRIDAKHLPNVPFAGTAWFVSDDVVVTNRHVAELIARNEGGKFVFTRGTGGRRVEPSMCTRHEHGGTAANRVFAVEAVLYIEPDEHGPDIAFLRVARPTGALPPPIDVSPTDVPADQPVCVIGYPARATADVIPDQARMQKLYAGIYDTKRIAPGLAMSSEQTYGRHDCTTLGGNSGSVVIDLTTGLAVGLHFAGAYKQANYTVPASTLHRYVARDWRIPQVTTETGGTSGGNAAGGTAVKVTIPLSITIDVGLPVVVTGGTRASERPAPSPPLPPRLAAIAAKPTPPPPPPKAVPASIVAPPPATDDAAELPPLVTQDLDLAFGSTPIRRKVRVRHLLASGAQTASDRLAVLELVRSATTGLLLRIPYLVTASPGSFTSRLLALLAEKLRTLDVAQLLVGDGPHRHADPQALAAYFRTAGVEDVAQKLRSIDGVTDTVLIANGSRILLGNHDWNAESVRDRDTALIFHDDDIAAYYSNELASDWGRAKPVTP